MRGSGILTVLCLTLTLIFNRAGCQIPGLPSSVSTSCGSVPFMPTNNTLGCCMCEDNRLDWWINNIQANLTTGIPTGEELLSVYVNSYTKWEQTCSWANGALGCIQGKIPGCLDADVGEKLIKQQDLYTGAFFGLSLGACPSCSGSVSKIISFSLSWSFLISIYPRFCNKNQLNSDIQTIVSDPSVNISCVGEHFYRDEIRCYSSSTSDLTSATLDLFTADPVTFLQLLKSQATDILNCMFSVINRSSCNTATRNVLYKALRLQMLPFVDDGTLNLDESTTEDFSSKLRCTVGVTGGTHLRTCWADPLVTCSAPGEQTFFSNKFLMINGTNVEIGVTTTPRATAIQSIFVTFSSLNGDTELGTYTATNGNLSSTFDGGIDTKIGSGNDEVEIGTGPFRFIQKGTGSVLFLGQWGGNYFFTLRMAENVMVGSSGLLIEGCPSDQVITRDTFLTTRRKRAAGSNGNCETSCNDTVTETRFEKACVIDCLATGDLDFATNMAKLAEEDDSIVLTYDSVFVEGASYPDTDKDGAAPSYPDTDKDGAAPSYPDTDKDGSISVRSTGFSLIVSALILNYILRA